MISKQLEQRLCAATCHKSRRHFCYFSAQQSRFCISILSRFVIKFYSEVSLLTISNIHKQNLYQFYINLLCPRVAPNWSLKIDEEFEKWDLSSFYNLITNLHDKTHTHTPVSYTHLDVYKRQENELVNTKKWMRTRMWIFRRGTHRASVGLRRELKSEDTTEYRMFMKMNAEHKCLWEWTLSHQFSLFRGHT